MPASREDVLQRNRHTRQASQCVAPRACPIDLFGAAPRAVFVDLDECADPLIDLGDAGQKRIGDVCGQQVASADRGGDLRRGT